MSESKEFRPPFKAVIYGQSPKMLYGIEDRTERIVAVFCNLPFGAVDAMADGLNKYMDRISA